MRRATSACRRRMRARVQNRCRERLSREVLRDVLGWGLSRGILGRCLKDRASQGPSFGAHVLTAFRERFGEGKSGGGELLVPVFGLREVASRARSLD